MIRDIKADLGTSEFGAKIANMLSGITTVAHAAYMIEKALAKLGMSVKEFKDAKNSYDLRLRIYNHIQKSNPSSKELDKMMAAADIIYKHDYDHKNIIKKMSNSTKGAGEDSDDEMIGGDDLDDGLPRYWSKKSLAKKITNKKKYRDLILKDFRKVIKAHYQRIVDSVDKIAKHIGVEIPISSDLDIFVKMFGQLDDFNQYNLHIALSGYQKDSLSKEQREKFLNSYNLVAQTIEPLTNGQQGQLFKDTQSEIRAMVKTIDDFSDKMVKAITEVHVDRPEEISHATRRAASEFFGSSDPDDLLGSGSFIAFSKVKGELTYYYNIANVKKNLRVVGEEMKVFGDDYESVLGEEAGWLIDNITKQYNSLINDTSPESSINPKDKNQNISHIQVLTQIAQKI